MLCRLKSFIGFAIILMTLTHMRGQQGISGEMLTFIKNNEYFSPKSVGLTALGSQTKLYYHNQQGPVALELGIFGNYFWGDQENLKILPIIAAHFYGGKGTFTLGSLKKANIAHELHQSIMRLDAIYEQPMEYGFQYYKNDSLGRVDIWLDWKKFIRVGDPFQERFVVGTHLEKKFAGLHVDGQVLIVHSGGQIDSTELPASTIFNGNMTLSYPLLKNQLLSPFIGYHVMSIKKNNNPGFIDINYDRGNALEIGLKSELRWGHFSLAYWRAEDFVSFLGEPILFNSTLDGDFYETNNDLILFMWQRSYELHEDIVLMGSAQSYYNIDSGEFDYSLGINFKIPFDVLIWKTKFTK